MKNINENTKVTLTVGQLKKLVNETKGEDLATQLKKAQQELDEVRAKYKARQGRGLIAEALKKAQEKVAELKKQLKSKEVKESGSGVDAFMKDDLRRYTVDFRNAIEKLSKSRDRETARRYADLLDALNENPRMLNTLARRAFMANAFSIEEIKRFIEFGRKM